MKGYTQLILAALAAGPLGAFADCSHNNCLRAIIADTFPTRNGTADCGSYLEVTVTPPTSTFTATVTASTTTFTTSTEVDTSVTVETVIGSTEMNTDTKTSLIHLTSTKIVRTVTATTTIRPGAVTPRAAIVDEKRQATAYGSTYPAYASACSSFAKYSSACSCVGAFPNTVTVAAPSTTVTVTSISSSTSVLVATTSTTEVDVSSVTATTLVTSTLLVSTTDATVRVTSTTTLIVVPTPSNSIVKNGGFESGDLSRWTVDTSNPDASVVSPGSNSAYALKTANLYKNNLFQIEQTLISVNGRTYACSYDWQFTNYYETSDDFVPYVHVYINDTPRAIVYSIPDPDSGEGLNQWATTTFQFTSGGRDILYFDCASPQNRTGSGGGSNYLYLDNIICVPA